MTTTLAPPAPPIPEVAEAEFLRLLGYPPGHSPGGRARELARWARAWYRSHGHAWSWHAEVELSLTPDGVELAGRPFCSPRLRDHLRTTGATRAVLLAVSAGPECEEEARRRWEAERPDEYFFLETFGSAVVGQLVAEAHGRLCSAASRHGRIAVPQYSPGYAGWDVAEQPALFNLVAECAGRRLPGPLEVLPSGMLRPKKSMLAVVGLAPRTEHALRAARVPPCERCTFAPCRFRRAAYRHAPVNIDGAPPRPPGAQEARTAVNPRALDRWARERLDLVAQADGTTLATFRFDGTTCSNLGHPLAFAYRVRLGAASAGYTILESDCSPLPGDTGHQRMCAFMADPERLLGAIARERPLVGRPLDAVLRWDRSTAPAGCLCDASGRARTWGLALEVIHYALTRRAAQDTHVPVGALLHS